jgi:hypothetical protein
VSPRKFGPPAIAAALSLGLAAPATAVAPKPSRYYTPGWGEGTGLFTLAAGKIAAGATAPSHFGCRMDTHVGRSIPVTNGAFRYSGKPKSGPGRIVFAGHWVSSSKIKGSTMLKRGSCSKTVRWTAVPFVQATNAPPASPGASLPQTGSTPPSDDAGPPPAGSDDTTPPPADDY